MIRYTILRPYDHNAVNGSVQIWKNGVTECD
jgi:hypothetical protein